MAKITHMIPGLTNGVTYYGKVYSVNPKKRANGRADLTVFAAIPSAFPAEPTDYTLIAKYTTSQTWVAPEDGWFKIEVHGASGSGAIAKTGGFIVYDSDYGDDVEVEGVITGGSGGGGGYSCSIIKMNKGDTVVIESLAIGSVATVYINSSHDVYPNILVSSGGSGTMQVGSNDGNAGYGGSASGGNYANYNGSAGLKGVRVYSVGVSLRNLTASPRPGGAPGHTDGNAGGQSGSKNSGTTALTSPGYGKAAFVNISRGNTNVTA